jgi:3-hydroxybutyryl-CoA dehydrogenase
MNSETVGVLGAGQMGAGIAQVATAAGHLVLMADVGREVVEKARAGIVRRLGGAASA